MKKFLKRLFRKEKKDTRNWIPVDFASVWVGTMSNGFSDYDISCEVLKGKTKAKLLDQKNGMKLLQIKSSSQEAKFKITVTQLNSETRKVRDVKNYYALLGGRKDKTIDINQWGEALVRNQ